MLNIWGIARRLRLVLGFVLAVSTPAAAQYLGLSLGHTSSTVDWQYPRVSRSCDACVVDVSPHDSRTSFAPALTMQWRADRWIGIASEARYTPKGYATSEPTLDVDYIEVPILARLGKFVDPSSRLSGFAEAGPAFALRAMCSVNYNGISDRCARGVAFGQDWRIRRFDVSQLFGIGVTLRVGDGVIVAGARADWGLVDIGRSQGVPTKNRSSLLYLGWSWKLLPVPRS